MNSIVDEEKIKKLGFITHLISFVKQSIKGAYLAVYKLLTDSKQKDHSNFIININDILDNFKMNTLVMEVMINYINQNWVSYHKKSDKYIIEKFELMVQFSEMKHIYCLFDFIWDFSQLINTKLAIKIDKQNLNYLENFNFFLDNYLDHILSKEIENLVEFNFSCSNICYTRDYIENVNFVQIKRN